MQRFITGHATHPDAAMALALVAAQIDAQMAARADAPSGSRSATQSPSQSPSKSPTKSAAGPAAKSSTSSDSSPAPSSPASSAPRLPPLVPTLGLVYFTDALAPQADALWAGLQQRWPGLHWAGAVGVGVMAGGVEYFDEPGLVVMLCDLPAAGFQIFNGRVPLVAGQAHSALVHADPATHDMDELISELAQRTRSGFLFGGVAASRKRSVHLADGVFEGGLSGVAFGLIGNDGAGPALLSRVTQGCQPMGPARTITRSRRNLVLALDGEPALPLLLAELGVTLDQPQAAMAALRATLVGLTDADDAARARTGQFGADTRVRHLIGIDPGRGGFAIADDAVVGQQLAFCRRDVAAARRDLVRICAEIRDELESDIALPVGGAGGVGLSAAPGSTDGGLPSPAGRAASRIAGAIYVSCSGRGGPHFGAPSAEAQIVQHALGDVPLVGFFAGGEIAHRHLYGYTGVLTVFVAD